MRSAGVLCAGLALLAGQTSQASVGEADLSQEPEGGGGSHQIDVDDIDDIDDIDLGALLDVKVGVGSATETDIRRAPATIEVLTAEEIARLGIADLRELLLHLAGVYERSTPHAPLFAVTPRFRGGSVAQRILVLVDEHGQLEEINEIYNAYAIPIGAIERAEFLRGPAAVLYGSSAMAGVLRLVTRKGEGTEIGTQVVGDPVGNGGYASAHGSLRMDVAGAPLEVRADVQTRRIEDYRIHIVEDIQGDTGRHRPRIAHTSTLATARWRGLYVRLQHSIQRARLLGLDTVVASDAGFSDYSFYGGEVRYRQELGDVDIVFSAALDHVDRLLDFGMLPPPPMVLGRSPEEARTDFLSTGYVAEGNLRASRSGSWWEASIGLQGRFLRTTEVAFRYQNDGTPHMLTFPPDISGSVDDINLLFQGRADATDTLSFLLGGRLNYYKPTAEGFRVFTHEEAHPDATISPMGQAALVWSATDWATAKLLYGRSFRLPTLMEMFSQVATVIEPNTDIEPEIQDTLEVALESQPLEALVMRVSGFVNIISRPIVQPKTRSASKFINNSEGLKTWGADLTVRWRTVSRLSVDMAFTYHEGIFDDGTRLGSMPPYLLSGRLNVDVLADHSFFIVPNVNVRGPMFSQGADVYLSFGAVWKLAPWVAAFVSSHNVFDRQIYVPFGSIVPNITEGEDSYVDLSQDAFLRRSRTLRLGIEVTY